MNPTFREKLSYKFKLFINKNNPGIIKKIGRVKTNLQITENDYLVVLSEDEL